MPEPTWMRQGSSQHNGHPLPGYRVLDFTGKEGYLCGKLLADLGCEVVKVERPGGDDGRGLPPFAADRPDHESSLYWLAYNAGKKSVTLDIETADGRDILRKLVRTANAVIESFAPGYLDRLGIGYSSLRDINETIVLTSITPFGQTGPRAGFRSADLTVMAESGQMALLGDADRAPLRIGFPQAYLHAGAHAAAATLIALYHRQMTGRGQRVDVSVRDSTLFTAAAVFSNWEMAGEILHRAGPYRGGLVSGILQKQIWECTDGYVAFALMGGAAGVKTCKRTVEWLDEEGMATNALKDMEWDSYGAARMTQDMRDSLDNPVAAFFKKHTKWELSQGAQRRGIMLYPVVTVEELLHLEQLEARGFWGRTELADGSHAAYPGGFATFSGATCGPRARAPKVGEHNLEVYAGLGLGQEDLLALTQAGAI